MPAQAPQSQVEVEIVEGDILTSKDCYILHLCNCVSSGTGDLAETIFRKFPEANTYHSQGSSGCYHAPGTIDVKGRIINCYLQLLPIGSDDPTENNPNTDTDAIRLKWFEDCLSKVEGELQSQRNIHLAFPLPIRTRASLRILAWL